MNIQRIRGVLLVVSSIVVLVAGQFGAVAAAAATHKNLSKPVVSGNGMKISPLTTDITIAPGHSGTVPVTITNVTRQTEFLQPIENDFIAGNETGRPALVLGSNSYAPTHSLKRFMVPLSSITVSPGQSRVVNVAIHVPKTAQAGGYFGALRFAPTTANGVTGTGVGIGESVASLILLTVPGPTVQKLVLTNFEVQQNGGTASSFRTPKDLALFMRFQNEGNLQEAPFGQIYVEKGKQVLYQYNFNQNQPQEFILPDSARRWTIPLKNLGKFGEYTIGATLTYGTNGQSIDVTKTVWIIPTVIIAAVVGGIILLALIIGGMWVFMKSYKRKILRSSRRRY